MIMRKRAAATAAAAAAAFTYPDLYWYKAIVKVVHDGDTVIFDVDQGYREWHHDMKIRFFGINAPELLMRDPVTRRLIRDANGHTIDNPDGIAARDFLITQLPTGLTVLLHSIRDVADNYGDRWDGVIYLINGTNINDLMISSGHANRYP